MKCPHCQARIDRDSKHCPECGKPISTSAAGEGAPASGASAAPEPARAAAAKPASKGETLAAGDLDGLRTIATPFDPTPNAGPALEPGTLFDRRFEIDSVIGRGGMGVVYRAKDTVTGDPVCLKLVHPNVVQSEAHVQRFLREGKLTRSLRHRNIVSVFDVNNSDGVLYLTMECIEGQSLRNWLTQNLRERRNVPLGVALSIGSEIAAGLAAAHAEGVVHRDLKPENVMLIGDPLAPDAPGTNAVRVKVLDFGIARALASREQLTVAGGALGTPVYMAPEQETSADAVGPEADVYSLGAVFYEVLLGVPPRGRFDLPSVVRPDLPRALDPLFERALSAHPSRRFKDAQEFGNELAKVQAGGGFTPNDWMGRLGELGSKMNELGGKIGGDWIARSHGRRWPRTFTQWIVVCGIPAFAWAGWITLWWRTRQGRHVAYAALYFLPFLAAMALFELANAPGTVEYTTSYDMWGNLYTTPIISGPDNEAAAAGYFGFIIVAWIVALVHGVRARPMIEAINAASPQQP